MNEQTPWHGYGRAWRLYVGYVWYPIYRARGFVRWRIRFPLWMAWRRCYWTIRHLREDLKR